MFFWYNCFLNLCLLYVLLFASVLLDLTVIINVIFQGTFSQVFGLNINLLWQYHMNKLLTLPKLSVALEDCIHVGLQA